MHIYNESTARRSVWCVKVNWSRSLTFSERQINYIMDNVPNARGVYCIYAKNRLFQYSSPLWATSRWSPVVYIGSGWLHQRLSAHLRYKKNELLADYLINHNLAYRFDRIADKDDYLDWPRTVEAGILSLFKERFGRIPLANRREESMPEMEVDKVIFHETGVFSILKRG